MRLFALLMFLTSFPVAWLIVIPLGALWGIQEAKWDKEKRK